MSSRSAAVRPMAPVWNNSMAGMVTTDSRKQEFIQVKDIIHGREDYKRINRHKKYSYIKMYHS